MLTLSDAFRHLSNFVGMTEGLQKIYLTQMNPETRQSFSQAIDFLIREQTTLLSEIQIQEIDALLGPFTKFMFHKSGKGVIDGRSSDASMFYGMTWLQIAGDSKVPVNLLINVSSLMLTTEAKPTQNAQPPREEERNAN